MAIARKLDPLSVGVNGETGSIRMFARRYEDAIAPLREALRLDPLFPNAHMVLAQSLASLGRHPEAVAEAERAASLGPGVAEFRAHVGYVLALAGNRAKAVAILRELIEGYQTGGHSEPMAIAFLHATLGNNDQAFEWLGRAQQARDPWLGYLRVDPRFDNLRTDSRFERLLQSVGLMP